jgi:hypothetical protein
MRARDGRTEVTTTTEPDEAAAQSRLAAVLGRVHADGMGFALATRRMSEDQAKMEKRLRFGRLQRKAQG